MSVAGRVAAERAAELRGEPVAEGEAEADAGGGTGRLLAHDRRGFVK